MLILKKETCRCMKNRMHKYTWKKNTIEEYMQHKNTRRKTQISETVSCFVIKKTRNSLSREGEDKRQRWRCRCPSIIYYLVRTHTQFFQHAIFIRLFYSWNNSYEYFQAPEIQTHSVVWFLFIYLRLHIEVCKFSHHNPALVNVSCIRRKSSH